MKTILSLFRKKKSKPTPEAYMSKDVLLRFVQNNYKPREKKQKFTYIKAL